MNFQNTLLQIRHVFLDMDDTIYRGSTLFPTTVPFLEFLTQRSIGYTFLSNNSFYSTAEYVHRVNAMGIPATGHNFYISTDYAIDYLRGRHPGINRIHLLGTNSLIEEFENAGFQVVDDDPDAVVVAIDRELTYQKLSKAAWFLRNGVPGFATHPDPFCSTDQNVFLPDCGAIVKCLEFATGKTLTVLGKPDPGILQQAMQRVAVLPQQALMVGDRLATDIAVGRNAGVWTCQVVGHAKGENSQENSGHFQPPHLQVDDLGELHSLWLTVCPAIAK